ncbi:protein-disulfide isomerase [Rivularia sp. PCC 7116]|uniref:DsbA family protein n=1 Tax=Rivularia sp. PCC 7116 TaxID=373994 RepID=UPI00029ED05D|nr:thioredoxin domain-containing protein [Rivularia sp. PCC 7116]AFY58921.1 protein-disulfide isomerase [Rivularia sp. PCC 7116]
MIQINSTKIPPLRKNDHIKGVKTTALVLMEYGDYQCSSSGKAHSTIEKLKQQLGDRFCFVFRHFPQPEIHSQSLKAAETAEAAAQGRFWQMHSLLFENQQALEDVNLIEYADRLKLDIPRILRELNERLHQDRIQQDIDSGMEHGVERTPTFFIGIRQEGTQNLETLLLQILETITKD